MRNVIGVWGISNTASLNVYEIRHGIEDEALVGMNADEPEWAIIQSDEEGNAFIEAMGTQWPLNECMKIH